MKKTVYAAVGAFFVMYILGGIYAGFLVPAFPETQINPAYFRMPVNQILVLAGYLVEAALMAALYRRFYPSPTSAALCGLKFGIVASLCFVYPLSLVYFGVYDLPYPTLIMGLSWSLLEQGAGGVVVGLIHGRQQPAT